MNEMAKKLAEMQSFLSTNSPQGNAFNSLRRELAKKLKDVASTTKAEFDDPWGMLAVYLAAGKQGAAKMIMNSQLVKLRSARP